LKKDYLIDIFIEKRW